MKQKIRKTLSMLAVLCMVIGLLPGLALTAAAASTQEVTVNNRIYLSARKPHYVNGKAVVSVAGSATLGEDGYTAYADFSGDTVTLTLKNYNGGRIYYGYGDLTVQVDGSNTIDSPLYEGVGASENLTARGAAADKNTDSLTITSKNGCISAENTLLRPRRL